MAVNKVETNKRDFDLSLIQKDDILYAFKKIDREGVPAGMQGRDYFVFYDNKYYPVIYPLKLAYKKITGRDISGFNSIQSNALYRKRQFKVVRGKDRKDIKELKRKDTVSQQNNIVVEKQPLRNMAVGKQSSQLTELTDIEFNLTTLFNDIRQTGLIYSNDLLARFALALLTKPFIILSGLSGSGKTQLALTFARWICGNSEQQIRLVSVGADWTNREPLLGYPNALEPGSYICPENGVLEILHEANNNHYKPYFLILDEMNLSYVERYFADFLSAMETNESIPLHSNEKGMKGEGMAIEPSVGLPRNLFIIGTINVDETTYMFSPKVLDRANVIEFRVSREEMADYLKRPAQTNNDTDILAKGANMATHFVQLSKRPTEQVSAGQAFREELLNFFTELAKTGAEFGYRTAKEILRFHALAGKLHAGKNGWNDDQIMDHAVAQKLLPRLHGSRKKIVPVLEELWVLCLHTANKKQSLTVEPPAKPFRDICRYPVSGEKIWRMYCHACENGFTSFAEA